MNLDLSKTEKLLKDSAREFLEKEFPKDLVREMEDDPRGYTSEIWRKMAELGWMALVIPEEYGGAEGTLMELVILLEEMGRACLTGPFLSTALCTLAILAAGNEEQKQEFLPKIANGGLVLALALTEPSDSYQASAISTKAVADKDEYILSGTKLFVQEAHVADWLICVAKSKPWALPEEGISLFLVDARSPGIKITPLATIADDKQNEVIFDEVRVPAKNLLGEPDRGWPVVTRLMEQAAIAKCAEMIGGAGWVVEASVAHAKQRVQYGRLIGSFGIIQHYLADMWTEVSMAQRLTYYAAWLMDQGLPCAREVAMAKAWVSDTYRKWTRMGVQIRGGEGTTRENDMGLYYRRARQAALLFGDPDLHREKVAQEMGL